MKNQTTLNMVFCGLFAAITAAASQVSVPIGPVPINLATLSVFIAGSVLGAKYGALSQTVFVLLGVFGLPVFAGFRGGAQAVAGPTGGYIVGYIAAAWLVGFLSERFGEKSVQLAGCFVVGLALCYTLGTAWFMFVTKTGLWAALGLCVVPFLVGDAAKIAVAAVVAPQLRKHLHGTVKNYA